MWYMVGIRVVCVGDMDLKMYKFILAPLVLSVGGTHSNGPYEAVWSREDVCDSSERVLFSRDMVSD